MALAAVPLGPVEAPRRRQRTRHRGRNALLVVLLLAALLGAGGWYLGAGPGAYVAVPKVVGSTQAQATQSLSQHGLSADVSQGYSERIPAGTVISADPGEGEKVHKNGSGRTGGLARTGASPGPDAGRAQRGRRAQGAHRQRPAGRQGDPGVRRRRRRGLGGVGLGQGRDAGPGRDDGRPRGQPGAGAGGGGSWVGKPADQAADALSKSGLKVKTSQAFSDTVAEGAVISQKPGAGTAFKGDTIKLVVSKGPELVLVPKVVGDQVEDAVH